MSVAELRAESLTIADRGAVVVRNLNLHARSGEVIGLTGPSGSGKSTVLHALGGLLPAADGRLVVDGRGLTPWRDVPIGLILQNLALVPFLSAVETVSVPLQAKGWLPRDVVAAAEGMLAAVGLSDHALQLVSDLSGGQRQRVAVARALAGRPDLILADEPASALDEHWRQVVLDLLIAEARRAAVVIIASSDPSVTAICDRLITLGSTDVEGFVRRPRAS
jgi:putative ABC transport system ATP-binding protein